MLSGLGTGQLYPQGKKPVTYFCYRLSRPQRLTAAGRNKLVKNHNDSNGNRNNDPPACSTECLYAATGVFQLRTPQSTINKDAIFLCFANDFMLNPICCGLRIVNR
jgi:hypothetical protein